MPADEGVTHLVTLEELKAHLRIEHMDEDAYLTQLLDMSRCAMEDFCKTRFRRCVPSPVRLAMLLHAGHFYTHRENGDQQAYTTMMQAFHALLWPYRDPNKLF